MIAHLDDIGIDGWVRFPDCGLRPRFTGSIQDQFNQISCCLLISQEAA
jgi:hypothetical protein